VSSRKPRSALSGTRDWKVNLIEGENPEWGDLHPAMMAP
jgi:hypothetical protein